NYWYSKQRRSLKNEVGKQEEEEEDYEDYDSNDSSSLNDVISPVHSSSLNNRDGATSMLITLDNPTVNMSDRSVSPTYQLKPRSLEQQNQIVLPPISGLLPNFTYQQQNNNP